MTAVDTWEGSDEHHKKDFLPIEKKFVFEFHTLFNINFLEEKLTIDLINLYKMDYVILKNFI